MAVFEYKGFNLRGKNIKGVVDAENIRTARAKLKKDGIIAVDLVSGEDIAAKPQASSELNISDFLKRITIQDISIFTRQLGTLLNSGLPLLESITAIIEQQDNLKFKKILTQAKEKLNEGMTLADSLKSVSEVFNPLYVNMISAGEAGGVLEVVLMRLAEYLDGQVKLKNKLISTMVYPAIMILLSIGVISFLMINVIPKVALIFSDIGKALPIYTRVLIFTSNIASNYWYLFIAAGVFSWYVFRRYAATPAGKERLDIFALSIPAIGKIIRLRAIARFSRTLATLLKSGIPVLQSMDIVKHIVNNSVLEKAIDKAMERISEGSTIAEPLKASGVFTPMVIKMISAGEHSGELEGMLEKIADITENEIDTYITTLTSLLEPLIILVLAGMVLFIILSVLMPIFQINQIVK